MRNPLKAVGQRVTSIGKRTKTGFLNALGLAPFEGDKTELRMLAVEDEEIEPISRFAIEIGLPVISIASEEIPSGEVLPSEESFVSSARLTNEERGRLLRVEERVRDLINRFQDYRQFQDEVAVDIKALHNSVDSLERMLEDMKDLRDGYTTVEKNLHELSALYDLISTQFNPFIDSTPSQGLFPENGEGELSERVLKVSEATRSPTEEKISEVYLLEWLGFLGTKIEIKQIPTLLKHYEENHVISQGLKEKSLRFLRSLRTTGMKPASRNDWRLSVEDQIRSMEYLQWIRGEAVRNQEERGDSREAK